MSALNSLDRNMPILVVDDYQTMRRVVRNCLRQLGFENVVEAEDGQIALDRMKEQSFQLVISDWNMPNMMGIDFLKAVRQDQQTCQVPFIMVTAENQKETQEQATQAGASNYIIKPFTADLLRQKLEKVFTSKVK